MTFRFLETSGTSDRQLTAAEVEEYIFPHVADLDRYTWYFREKLLLHKIGYLFDGSNPRDISPQGWIRWLQRERAIEEFSGRWEEDFIHWFTTGGLYTEDCAIIVTELDDSSFGVHDGNHRVAVAYEQGMKTVPAFVGMLKNRDRSNVF